MSAETRASIIVFLIMLVAGMGLFFGIRYESNSSRADAAEVRADAAEKSADQTTVITSNVLTTMSVFNAITRANADAKQQIDTDTEPGLPPSKRLFRMMTVLSVMFLPLLLSSCVQPRTEYVPVPPVPIPADLLIDCLIPEIPTQMTYGGSLMLNKRLLGVIEKCNQDKANIRKVEEKRQASTKDKP